MTEAAYQAARKVMQRATYMRGLITSAEGEVAKWTAIESAHREQLQQGKAEGAKKMLDKAIAKLKQKRELFEALTFPPHDLTVEQHRCKDCGRKLQPTESCICIYE